MTPGRIKELLHAWRPGAEAPGEAERAREVAASDAALAAWLEQERAFDQAFANKLREVKPPPGLMEQILAAAAEDNVVQFEARVAQARARQSWWRPFAYGVAASVALMAGILGLVMGGGSPEQQQRFDMAGLVNKALIEATSRPMEERPGFEQVRQQLVSIHAPAPEHLPIQFSGLTTVGFKVFDVDGSRMSMICLRGDRLYHLMVANESCITKRACERYARPVLYDLGDRFAAAWVSGGKVFIFVTDRQGESIVRQIHDI